MPTTPLVEVVRMMVWLRWKSGSTSALELVVDNLEVKHGVRQVNITIQRKF